jgi:hypothetical protein
VAGTLTEGLIARVQGAPATLALGSGVVLGWLARGTAEVEPRTREAWQRFVARKPFWD